jgi:hypothetical protein
VSWITFTADDVKTRLAVREMEVYEETASEEPDGTPGAEERLPVIVSQVLGQFRGAIRANPQVTELGPAGTLPDFCIAWAAVIARVALVGMNPVPEGMTDPRRDEYRDAVKGLETLRSLHPSAFALEDPSAATSGASYGGAALLDF